MARDAMHSNANLTSPPAAGKLLPARAVVLIQDLPTVLSLLKYERHRSLHLNDLPLWIAGIYRCRCEYQRVRRPEQRYVHRPYCDVEIPLLARDLVVRRSDRLPTARDVPIIYGRHVVAMTHSIREARGIRAVVGFDVVAYELLNFSSGGRCGLTLRLLCDRRTGEGGEEPNRRD